MINAQEQFPEMLRRARNAVEAVFPITSRKGYVLNATNWRWTDVGDDIRDNIAAHKQAKLKEGSITAKLLADLKITGPDNKVVDSKPGSIVLRVPHVTAKSSYIVRGKEIQVVNQLRLRPGLYTRQTVDNNIETFVNTSAAGTYRVLLDREKGKFLFRVGPSAHFPLPVVLKALGVSDGAMIQAWGQALFTKSMDGVVYDAALRKLFTRLRPHLKFPPSLEEAEKVIAAFLDSKPLDPKVNEITIGAPHRSVTGSALLDASRKCLALSRDQVRPDDTEDLAFKSIHSVEDFVDERLTKALPTIVRSIQAKMDRDPKIELAAHVGLFSDPVTSFFTTSEFARHTDQTNPVEMVSTNFLTTTMGEGGISSSHAVTEGVRLVHPSHIGVLDPLQTPEGQKIGITGHLTLGAKKIGNELYIPVINAKTGKRETKSLKDLSPKTIAFPDQYDMTAKPPKALSAEVKGRRRGELGTFRASEVDYLLVDPKVLFSPTSNMVPFLHNNDGNRVGMADRHIEQTIPLVDPDKPLVQARFGSGGYEDRFGVAFLSKSPVDGTVTSVTKDVIEITGGGSKHQVSIHDNYPLNSNVFLTDRPIVKKGDKVKKGQILVENNFTKDHSLAMGKNLSIAYMPYKGRNFEDGIVISESAAKKLTSAHKYEFRLERDKSIRVGVEILLAHFPDQRETVPERKDYDQDGVIKKGVRVNHGQLLIPAVREQQLHEDYDFAKLHRALSNQWIDQSIYWDHDHPGTVMEVTRQHGFIKVLVATEEAAQIGDKLCFDPEHDVLTRDGWKPVASVTEADDVATLNPATGELEYQRPTATYRYDLKYEDMYRLRTQQLDTLVTPDHRLYVNRRGRADYELVKASDVNGKRVRFKKDAHWSGRTPDVLQGYETLDFCRFLGFYLAEGSLEAKDYRIIIHQTKEAGREWFRNLATRLQLRAIEQADRFIIYKKDLWEYLKPLGDRSWLKRFPAEVLEFGQQAHRALWDGFVMGDGTVTGSGQEIAITTSEKLRDQLQEIALKAGWSANWTTQKDGEIGDTKVIKKTGQTLTKRRDCYHVRLVKAKNRPQINHGHIEEQNAQIERIEKYTGPVHCVTVPNHILYVRRGGKPHWSGNSMRHGGKGIITAVIPDNEMYQNSKGEPIDVLFNPTGVPGRVNPGQLYEAAAGKLAKKTGQPFLVDNFGKESTLDLIRGKLKAAGMDENGEETVIDPTTGRKYDRVMVGDTHFLKLKHMVAKKFSARSVGEQYTVNQQPAKTEDGSAQSIGGLELYALLAGDATKFVDDAFTVKGQRNDEYWRAMQLGLPLPKPQPPFVAEKFHTYMLGAGISLQRNGDQIKALPLTDKEIRQMSNGAIEEPTVVTANDLKPEKRGLFDPTVTGGIGGSHWAHIELAEPIVNPLMTKPVATVLGMTGKELDGLMDGSLGLKDGKVVLNSDGKLETGGEAIEGLLKQIDVKAELKKVEAEAMTTKSAARRDALNKKRRYLAGLASMGMRPEDAYINRLVPVVPPKFRAIYPLPDGSLNVSDPVHGYREVLLVSNMLRDMKRMGVSAQHIQNLRGDLHKATAGLVGTMEPLTREAHFKGFLSQIKGQSNKSGFFQGRVMRRQQDLSARSTVIPDPKLGLDEVGIPTKMGLKIYKPFLVKRLIQLGHNPLDARKMVEEGDPLAVKVLGIETQERPVFMNRAPSLHKFNVLAFKPRLVGGEAIQVNPLIVKGYNMDFDGDTVGIHVPVSEGARVEALTKMLPSVNMFSPANNRVMHVPTMETPLGLYLMSNPKGTPKPAASEAEVIRQYTSKAAQVNDAFKVGGVVTCAGQILINKILPAEFRLSGPMTKKVMEQAIEGVAKKYPKKAPEILNKLKDLGNHYVTEVGFSVSLRDLDIDRVSRDKILAEARVKAKKIGFDKASEEALKQISDLVHSNKENRFVELSTGSGALSGKAGSVNRMVASPVAVTDHTGKAIPVQITKSYAEGHDMGSYWATMPGARKGLMDKGLSTADTGYLTKRLVQSNIDVVVSEPDCRTTEGVWMDADDPDILDRVGAMGELRNQVITSDVARKLKGRRVMVRSPLKCRARSGICQKCFGLSEKGQFYPVGFHLGILAAQTIGEPSTQLALRTFHTGGAIGGASGAGFPRVNQLFSLPDNVKNKAVLAMEGGRISKVTQAAAGGWDVMIGTRSHYIPQELGLNVRQGQMVRAGEQISKSGVLRPQDLLAATGSVDQVRDAIINELDHNFRESGVQIKRRIYETAVRPLTSWARVTDPGDGIKHGIHLGDVVQVNRLDELNKDKKLKRKIEYEVQLVGVAKVPHLGDDFIGRLMHDRLMDTFRDAPAYGLTANRGPDGHPVTQLALRGVQDIRPAGVPRA